MHDTATNIRHVALNLLARREHATAELSRKLIARGCDEAAVHEVMVKLSGEGLLSDRRFAEQFTASKATRGKGPLRIRLELSARGVGESTIDDALAVFETDWNGLAAQVREKRFGSIAPEEFPDKARQGRFLQQRGFTSEQIHFALEHSGDSR